MNIENTAIWLFATVVIAYFVSTNLLPLEYTPMLLVISTVLLVLLTLLILEGEAILDWIKKKLAK